MIVYPTTLKEIQALINDEIQESLHLDYKEARAVGKTSKQKFDFAKDVSAFANSDGGVLIYGIQEKGHLPTVITGIDHSQFSREFIEQIIRTNISSPSPNFTVVQIPTDEKESVYVVKVEKSFGTPHQCKEDKKFYRRYNFESVAMESYEIDDIRNRRQISPSLISITATLETNMQVYLEVKNIGNEIAKDVSFEFDENFGLWIEENKAKIFNDGIKYFPPTQKYRFRYGFINSILHENSRFSPQVKISVNYNHPSVPSKIKESFAIDLVNYFGTYTDKSDITVQGEKLEKELKELTREIKKINDNLSKISRISDPTGLDLSIITLKNLKNLLSNQSFEKIDPTRIGHSIIKEILQIDSELAMNLDEYFWRRNDSTRLKDVEGITEEVIEKIKQHFILDE